MREENRLNDELRELEEDLARSVQPVVVRIDPFAAAFSAGRASARRETRVWRGASLLLLLAGVGSWMIPGRESKVPGPAPMTTVAIHDAPRYPASGQSLIMLQRLIDRDGIERLPSADVPPVGAVRASDAL